MCTMSITKKCKHTIVPKAYYMLQGKMIKDRRDMNPHYQPDKRIKGHVKFCAIKINLLRWCIITKAGPRRY
jgi:hypothetical protein